MNDPKKYHAFISYSHQDNGAIAPYIQRAIENIGKPWYKPGRLLNIFRDETNLSASPELWKPIEEALYASENFILLASPLASSSKWIAKEINTWKDIQGAKNGIERLFIVLTHGEIKWDDQHNDFNWDVTTALPRETLSGQFNSEPLWIDLRQYAGKKKTFNPKAPGFISSITKIAAAILGKPPREVESDELRRKRRLTSFLTATALILLGLIVSAFFLYRQSQIEKNNSQANSLIAEGNRYAQSNISKAFMYYYHAYLKSPQKGTFQLLDNHYHAQIEFSRYKDFDENTGELTVEEIPHDTVNMFFKSLDSLPEYWSPKKLVFDISLANLIRMITDQHIALPEALAQRQFAVASAPDLGFLAVYEPVSYQDWGKMIDHEFYIMDTETKKFSLHRLATPYESTNGEIKDCQLSNTGDYIYFKYGSTAEGADLQNVNYIFDLRTNMMIRSMSNGIDGRATDIEEIKSFTFGSGTGHYCIYGNQGGEIVAAGGADFSYEISSFPDGRPPNEEISTIWFNNEYIFTGTRKGVLTVWLNEISQVDFEHDFITFSYLSPLLSVNIPLKKTNTEKYDGEMITGLRFNEKEKSLAIQNHNGDTYEIALGHYQPLSTNVKELKNFVKRFGLDDISAEEKEQYNITK
jgi:hypothetical protein